MPLLRGVSLPSGVKGFGAVLFFGFARVWFFIAAKSNHQGAPVCGFGAISDGAVALFFLASLNRFYRFWPVRRIAAGRLVFKLHVGAFVPFSPCGSAAQV